MPRSAIQARSRPGKQTAQWAVVPAFVGGVNAQESLLNMQPNEMIYSYNMVPNEAGLLSRRGNTEWSNGVSGSPETIISFQGKDDTLDKIFVASDDGIYEVTDSGDGAAVLVFSFATPSSLAGYGVYTSFVNDAQEQYILYADSVNGLHIYTGSTDTWILASGITGLPGAGVAGVRFVGVHKLRVWLIMENDADAFYLPVSSIAGAANIFLFGGNMSRGGDLVGLFNWTRDGGDGIDDYLIAVGRGGDVMAYRGQDPAFAVSWQTVGTWYIGHVPAGRRCATNYGGEVWLLSTFGIVSVSELFRGVEVSQERGTVSGKISRVLRIRIRTTLNLLGWAMIYDPSQGELIITSPTILGSRTLQYVLNLSTGGWGFWRDLDLAHFEPHNNRLYGISSDGRVWTLEDSPDNVLINDPEGLNIRSIGFSILSSYQDMDSPGTFKIIEFLRAIYQSSQVFSSVSKAVPDYQLAELPFTPGSAPLNSGGVWDTALWDKVVWIGDSNPTIDLEGGAGIGLTFGIALQGSVFRRVALISTGISWREGGNL